MTSIMESRLLGTICPSVQVFSWNCLIARSSFCSQKRKEVYNKPGVWLDQWTWIRYVWIWVYLDSIAEFEDPDGDIVVFSGRQEFYTKWVILHCVAILLWPIEGATLLKNSVTYVCMHIGCITNMHYTLIVNITTVTS